MRLFQEMNMKLYLKKIKNAEYALILKKLMFIYQKKVK